MGIASLIAGIVSLVMILLGMISKWTISFGALPSIAARLSLILGIIDIIQKRKNGESFKKSIIGIILGIIYIIIFASVVTSSVSKSNNGLLEKVNKQKEQREAEEKRENEIVANTLKWLESLED